MSSFPQMFSLAGKRVLVTGASRGIGAAIAVACAEAGADILLVARGTLEDTAERVEALGRTAHCLPADLSNAGNRAALWAQVEKETGIPDVLFNNAGIIRRHDFTEHTDEDWNEVLEVNLTAAFDLSRRFTAALRQSDKCGKVIHTLSLLSFQGGIRAAAYTAAKSGLLGLTRVMANELAPHGINVNAIVPGYIATENTAALRADSKRNGEILSRIPAGRWGLPEDLGGAAVFLASSASNYIHGTALPVDGGWLAR